MKNVYRHFLALSVAAASLSSCSRASYTFNPQTPAYLGTTRTVSAPVAAAPVATPTAIAPAAEPLATAPAPRTVAAAPSVAAPAQAASALQATQPAALATQAPAAKPTLVQRLALKQVMKQVAKADLRQQNTAGVAHTAAKGTSLTITIVGLVALIIGLIANSALLIVLGSIVLIIGLILLLLKAL